MSIIVSSVSEILRVGGWALRGIGYPFGVAERGTRLLAWSEAASGNALRGLRLSAETIAPSHRPGSARHEVDELGRRIHFDGRHLLELGGPVIDLATNDARRDGAAHVVIDDFAGVAVLPALANLLGRRGLSGMFYYRAAEGDPLALKLAGAGWFSVTPGTAGIDYLHGTSNESGLAVLRDMLQAARSDKAAAIVAEGKTQAAALSPGQIVLVAVSGARAVDGNPPADAERIDYAARYAESLSDGVLVEARDLKFLYDLEVRTWAPTSERSRSQAGYGVY